VEVGGWLGQEPGLGCKAAQLANGGIHSRLEVAAWWARSQGRAALQLCKLRWLI
jgi:hypothetical protein